MKALAKFAAAATLVMTTATAANATYYPENPCPPETPTTPSKPSSTVTNNSANAAANASASANAAAIANGGKAIATGGQGGKGGQGGAGGKGGAGGSVGNVAGGSVGNVAGGSVGNVAGGAARSGDVVNAPVTNTNFEAPMPIGNAPAVFLNPTGDCGEGWSLSIGAPYAAIGGGKTTQNRVCLSQKAAMAIINAGIVKDDDGMIVAGMETLAAIHPEVKSGLEAAGVAFSTTCVTEVVKRSRVLAVGLTQDKCDTVYAGFNVAAAVVQPVAPKTEAAPTAPAGPSIPDCGSKPVVWNPVKKVLECGRDLN